LIARLTFPAFPTIRPGMRQKLRRLIEQNLDYSTRYHLKARLRAIDIKFVAAIVALIVGIYVVLRLY
jgi:hypothetical protein